MKTLTTAVITFVSGTLLCVCSYVVGTVIGYALCDADKERENK